MAFRDGPLQDLKVPLVWTAAISAVLAACVALGLLITDGRERPNGGTYGSARGEFDEVMQPVSGVLARPLRAMGSFGKDIGAYIDAGEQNKRLLARVKELEHLRDENQALRNTNTRYEQLLALKTDPPAPMVTARVVTDVRGPFSNARLADAGSDRGVKVGYPVMSDHGAVGRVVGVAHGVSRILLLTDVDSRTPVLVDRTGSRAILTGDGGSAPRMEYLRGPSPVKQGDVVMTSGDGGVFPRGLPIGVAAQDIRGGWRVRLYAETQDVDYVRILMVDDFSKLPKEQQAELNAKASPPLPEADAAQLQAAVAAKGAPTAAAFSGLVAGTKPAPAKATPPPAAATAAAPPPTPSKPAPSKPADAKPAPAKPTAGPDKAKPKPKPPAPAKKPPIKPAPADQRMAPIPDPPARRVLSPAELDALTRNGR